LNVVTVCTTEPAQEITIAQAFRTERGVLEALIAVYPDAGEAVRIATAALASGFAAAKSAHLAAAAAAMQRSWLEIGAETLARQGMMFGHMQLEMALCRDNPRVSVPIKGLTGEGYRFMVFWDTDYHMFPYYLLTNPVQAANLIRYRYHLLDAARANAKSWGYRGAQVPWETGTSGEEETAPWLCLQERELHISADAAYMVKLYDELSDDDSLLVECGSTSILFDTGATGAAVRNAENLGLDLSRIDKIVLSHGHFDHTGGLRAVLQKLQLPYRVVTVCTGDLGIGQAFKYDIETWMPSRSAYGETHSASRFYDFQARRLNLRYRDKDGKLQFCHTLNNTVIASPRVLIPIMELYQNADGSITVPRALRPYMGGMERIEKKG
jgi:hypothetical protein